MILCWTFIVLVCWGASQEFLSLLWCESHTNSLSEKLEEGERKKVREKREVSQQKGADEISRLERAVKRRRRTQSTGISMASGFCGSFARVHARVSSQKAQKVSRNSPSCAWSWPKSVFIRSFVLFCHPLSCVSVKKCVILLVGDDRNHWTILMVIIGLRKLRFGDRPPMGIGT